MPAQFKEMAALWKADKRRWVKPGTYATYVTLLNKHILPFFSPADVPLTDQSAQTLADAMLSRGLSIKTVKDCVLVLRMIVKYGARQGAWPMLEMEVHYPAPTSLTSPMVLSRHDQKRLQTYLQEHFSFRNLGLLICLQGGLRIGEVCALQWQDLNMADGLIIVRKTIQRIYLADGDERENRLLIHSPKTASSFREVPLEKSLLRLLRPLKKVVLPHYYVLTNGPEPLEPRTYREYFHRLMRQLGLPPLRFHGLRHSFATRCIESKCDYKTVSVILGHASIATTLNLYVHPGTEEKKRCVERMVRGLGY